MKPLFLVLLVVSAGISVSCTQTPVVQVIDSKTKLPVSGASVRAIDGDYYTGSNVTGYDGTTAKPALPGGASELEIRRSGYGTTRVKY
jgi:hypothetical protein